MAHGQAQCPVSLKNGHTGVDGLPCQPISLSLKLRNDFRALQNPFVGNHTSGMAKPRIGAFLRLLWLRCLNDKTSHRFQGEDIANCLQSPIFERREKEQLGWLTARESAVHHKHIAITRFAAHLSRPKMPDITTLAFGLYITYRAILNIGLYNWQPQKRLQKLR